MEDVYEGLWKQPDGEESSSYDSDSYGEEGEVVTETSSWDFSESEEE